MALKPQMSSNQWLASFGLFLLGGVVFYVLLIFAPSLVFLSPILIVLLLFMFAAEGIMFQIMRAITWPFRRNRPEKPTDFFAKTPEAPWPLRYAFLFGFIIIGTLLWTLTGLGTKEYF